AIFAALVSIFGKIGLSNIDSLTATAIRSMVMFVFMMLILVLSGKITQLNNLKLSNISIIFIILSGIAGILSWIFYFSALKLGDAYKVAVIDRLSIVFVFIFSILVLNENFSIKSVLGIILVVLGSILVIL
ncbi:MAG: EamA family transporter, partial [Nanopusillaceae archaeon]